MMNYVPEACWLAADYHMASLYACRVPMSSNVSARAMPTPGPATVQLALIRTSIECFGLQYTRDCIFPQVRTMPVYIRPPEHVALSNQIIRAYKVESGTEHSPDHYQEAPIYREMAHALGCMTLWIEVPKETVPIYQDLLSSIGYWGTADSLASCTSIYQDLPQQNECIMPLREWSQMNSIGGFFTCLVTELVGSHLYWEQIMPTQVAMKDACIRHELYVWPMLIRESHGGGTILQRCSYVVER